MFACIESEHFVATVASTDVINAGVTSNDDEWNVWVETSQGDIHSLTFTNQQQAEVYYQTVSQ